MYGNTAIKLIKKENFSVEEMLAILRITETDKGLVADKIIRSVDWKEFSKERLFYFFEICLGNEIIIGSIIDAGIFSSPDILNFIARVKKQGEAYLQGVSLAFVGSDLSSTEDKMKVLKWHSEMPTAKKELAIAAIKTKKLSKENILEILELCNGDDEVANEAIKALGL